MIPGWIEASGLPRGVRGGTATRRFPGVSRGGFGPANFGAHCGDDPEAVACNRDCLVEALDLPGPLLWLRQVHGTAVWVDGPSATSASGERIADACVMRDASAAAVVLTADCLPILLASASGEEIAAIHAGWRGLAAGVIEATLASMHTAPERIVAWLGPAIGPASYEVGPEVREAMRKADPEADRAFQHAQGDRLLADIYLLARHRLERVGVKVSGSTWCTFDDARLHSYRRDGALSGRMATLIWRT